MADQTPEMTPDGLAERARVEGVEAITAARVAELLPGLTSLRARLKRLGELLPPQTAPPPNRAPR